MLIFEFSWGRFNQSPSSLPPRWVPGKNGELGAGKGGVLNMMETVVRDDETLESALRRFRRLCNQSGLMSELRRRAHYEKPSDAKRRERKKRLRRERR